MGFLSANLHLAMVLLQALKIVDLYGKKNIDVSKQLYIKVM